MRILYYLIILCLLGGIIGVGGAIWAYRTYSVGLPDHTKLRDYDPARVSRLFSEDGDLMADYARERRIYLTINQIPTPVKQAFLAIEDGNFYKHPGIDFMGILRAVYNNLILDRPMQGASTITQQVVKNILLTNEKSFERKIREAILAYRLTVAFTKDQILEIYLNEIYLGAGAYGVGAAALTYFNKSVDDLTLEEAALLAALPKAPSKYNPYRYQKAATERRNLVLNRMAIEGFISSEDAHSAMGLPITLSSSHAEKATGSDYFSEEVRRQLISAFGEDKLYKKGLIVNTTFRPDLQVIAEKALRNGLDAYTMRHGYKGAEATLTSVEGWEKQLESYHVPPQGKDWEVAVVLSMQTKGKNTGRYDIGLKGGAKSFISFAALTKAMQSSLDRAKKLLKTGDVIFVAKTEDKDAPYMLKEVPKINGAVVALDPHTGRVYALVGGYAYGDSQFNRATQAARQPGSTFKPIVTLAALENGYSPSDLVSDTPLQLTSGIAADGSKKMWSPQNHDGERYGPTTIRGSVEKSINIVTVHLSMSVGLKKIYDMAKNLEVTDHKTADLSMVLGTHETTLLNMASAYGMIANGGKRIRPYVIERVHDHTGKLIFRHAPFTCTGCDVAEDISVKDATMPEIKEAQEQVFSPQTAYQVQQILRGVVERGTARAAAKIPAYICGKTGTTNDSYDAWFIGFTPDLVIGVYTGFDQPKTLGKKEYGSTVALPIFMEMMEKVVPHEKTKTSTNFVMPDGIVQAEIDRKTGYLKSNETPVSDVILESFKTDRAPTYSMSRSAQLPIIGTGGVNFGNIGGSSRHANEESDETPEDAAASTPASQQQGYPAWIPPDSVQQPITPVQPAPVQPIPLQPAQ